MIELTIAFLALDVLVLIIFIYFGVTIIKLLKNETDNLKR